MNRIIEKTYKEIVSESINAVQLDQTVTKILRYIDELRDQNCDLLARRWPIELIQNAKDVAYNDIPVKIKLVYEENENGIFVRFSHNGKHFTTKNVLHLINQVSSKAEDKDSTGKFGTGFMTTYLLSEKVSIAGVAKDENASYKRFTFCIDRSDNTPEGVRKSLKNSTEEFLNIDNNEIIDEELYDKNSFNTTFNYVIENERSKKSALLGIDDLFNNVNYILAFNENIDSVEIIKKTFGNEKRYFYKKNFETIVDELQNIKKVKIDCISNEMNDAKNYEIIIITNDGINVARAIDKNKILRFDNKLSILYRDFPLIGSEKFCLPFVINSKNFFPNEERSSIS